MTSASESLSAARGLVRRRLSAASLGHSERVAASARTLASRFGVDPDGAELAGLLHDYARDIPRDDLVDRAEELGVTVLPVERDHPYLLHARVGAAEVRRDLPGIDETVVSAIAAHTVGAVPMSDLERVVYLADMIEPARHFPGVDRLRASCEAEPLAECFRVGYGMSLRHVRESGRPVHPASGPVAAAIERETGKDLFDPPVEER